MHRADRILIVALLAVAGAGAPVAAQTTQPSRQESLRRQRLNYEELLKEHPSLGLRKMSDILELRVEDGQIVLHTPLTPWQDFLEHRVDIEGLSAPAIVAYSEITALPFRARRVPWRQFEFKQEDYPDPDTFVRVLLSWHTPVRRRPSELTVQWTEQTSRGYQRMIYRQTPADCVLSVLSDAPESGGEVESFEISAFNFIELRQQNPAKVEKWLRPVFTRLLQDAAFAPDANTAWQVLAEHWPAPQPVRAEVLRLLPKLADDDWHIRNRTADDLARLGRDGATQILRLDRHGLTVEQNVLLDQVLSRFRLLPPQDAHSLAEDPDFLLDCQYSEESTVRHVAIEQLARVLRHAVDIDPEAPLKERASSIEKIRHELHRSTKAEPH